MVVNKMPASLASPGTSLALNVYYFGSHGYPDEAAATGVVLLALVMGVNILATALGKVFGKGELANG
jgi:ABC-type phosphate transport system permease subunit